MIKWMNLTSRTSYEKHIDNQEQFKKLMPILKDLTRDEARDLVHLVRNKNRELSESKSLSNTLIDEACSDELKKRLAKLSEEENFALKNRYRFDKTTMKYADKSKMPLD